MYTKNSENISLSNPRIAFYGRKSDLQIYNPAFKVQSQTIENSDGSGVVSSYLLYIERITIPCASFVYSNGNSIANNITISSHLGITY